MKAFSPDALSVFGTNWALLTAGTPEHFNTMTIGWCGIGRMWNKPSATVYVRESRYTLEFMNENDYFTVSIYPKEYLPDLQILGKYSGRDCDKVGMTRLTPQAVENSMTFAQASVTLVCRKMYVHRRSSGRDRECARKLIPGLHITSRIPVNNPGFP